MTDSALAGSASQITTLRPIGPEDNDFLFRVYRATREAELAPFGWTEDQLAAFLQMQFHAREDHYRMMPAAADQHVILSDGRPVGRLIIVRTNAEIRLADIALLPADRGFGIGSFLVQQLIDEAKSTARPLVLHVAKTNRAVTLYHRLGFVVTGEAGYDWRMEWQAPEREQI